MLQKVMQPLSSVLTTHVAVIESQSPDPFRKINSLADFALTPVRYLVGGKPTVNITYSAVNPKEVYELCETKPGAKSWQKTLLMVAALIPGLILGGIGKAIALISSNVRRDIQTAADHLQLQMDIKISNQILAPKYKELSREIDTFQKSLHNSRRSWNDKTTQNMFDSLIKKAAIFMDGLFAELARCGKNSSKKMAEILSMQPHHYESAPIFCYCYFNGSIWNLYDTARNLHFYVNLPIENRERRGLFSLFDSLRLTPEDEAPFFNEGTLQFGWRQLYNEQASKLDVMRPNGDGGMKSMRDYFKLGGDRIDARCNVAKDEKPVICDGVVFITKPGCPTMPVKPLILQD